jgi:hypothetical protein
MSGDIWSREGISLSAEKVGPVFFNPQPNPQFGMSCTTYAAFLSRQRSVRSNFGLLSVSHSSLDFHKPTSGPIDPSQFNFAIAVSTTSRKQVVELGSDLWLLLLSA